MENRIKYQKYSVSDKMKQAKRSKKTKKKNFVYNIQVMHCTAPKTNLISNNSQQTKIVSLRMEFNFRLVYRISDCIFDAHSIQCYKTFFFVCFLLLHIFLISFSFSVSIRFDIILKFIRKSKT